MRERYLIGMKHLSSDVPQQGVFNWFAIVFHFTDDGISRRGKVGSDLMCPARFDIHLQIGGVSSSF